MEFCFRPYKPAEKAMTLVQSDFGDDAANKLLRQADCLGLRVKRA